jgi:hypothetical protein
VEKGRNQINYDGEGNKSDKVRWKREEMRLSMVERERNEII